MTKIDDERQAFADDEAAFQQWASQREWMDDLALNATVAGVDVNGPGYLYPGDFYIQKNTTDRPDLGEYTTMCPFDVWGELDMCERALWAEYGNDIKRR